MNKNHQKAIPYFGNDSSENTILHLESFTLKDKIRYMLESEYENQLKQYAANLYKSCNNQNKREEVSYKTLLKFIDEIGGFPLNNQEWNQNSYNFENAFVTLRSKHDLNVIIELTLRSKRTYEYRLKVRKNYA
ncbi:hypothetical protein B4U80_14991 [Leptotrombidium deliense]|uniref:Peptidase M13 N-terminal domain-containing protein n=1 Tax=Leptotrombidium deliense TaxID=299467 RepID=A0A443RUP5_9ACAR|nr:hypothetical protein B4U80_14991 [Leptotrombidium deliense]